MADLVIESLAREIVEHLYARFQVAEKNEKIAALKAENKHLRSVIEWQRKAWKEDAFTGAVLRKDMGRYLAEYDRQLAAKMKGE